MSLQFSLFHPATIPDWQFATKHYPFHLFPALCSPLIIPSITFLVSSNVLQASAFTEWQLNRTLWKRVCVRFLANHSTIRNSLKATHLWMKMKQNSGWHLVFCICAVYERLSVFRAGAGNRFHRGQQWNVADSLVYSGVRRPGLGQQHFQIKCK